MQQVHLCLLHLMPVEVLKQQRELSQLVDAHEVGEGSGLVSVVVCFKSIITNAHSKRLHGCLTHTQLCLQATLQ